MGYISVSGELSTEKVIERSRFITTSAHVEGEAQAQEFIARISAKYKDATHNCYAYIADSTGNSSRFSDNGEPSGTAGMPILEVLKNKKIFCVAVVVTRYFGGIKLGAGGLVRAYSGCTAENLDAAVKLNYLPCEEYSYTVGYESADVCARYFSLSDCDLKNTDYLSDVTYTVAVKKELAEKFNSTLFDKLSGRVKIEKLKEFYHGFKM